MNDLRELDKLQEYLDEHHILYERIDRPGLPALPGMEAIGGRHQINVLDKDKNVIWDAICHYGSYGYEEGLLEVMGEKLIGHDDVEGYLTAEDVIEFIEKMN
jgi:hypothetical protein